jgi:uncharacterized protein (DUF302 family)
MRTGELMETIEIPLKRYVFDSTKPFDEVLRGLYAGIGTPDMETLNAIRQEADFESYQRMVQAAVGPAELMQFLRLDLGNYLAKHAGAKVQRVVRIIAGNPLIMRRMVSEVPHAGSYAPITLLVYETEGKVFVAYDSMESALQAYGNEAALGVARELDGKVVKLVKESTG